MGKVVGSYASVTRGVSEQVPQDRHPGQMWEQVNMISDPVVGLARRPGSKFLASQAFTGATALSDSLRADLRLYRNYTFFMRSKEYVLLYRDAAAASPYASPPFICYCKTDKKFLGVTYADATDGSPQNATALSAWLTGGVSAVTTVGDFLVLGANTLGPGYSLTDNYAATGANAVGWVRGGAYSRTYTLKVTRKSDGHAFSVSYTTMASSYPNLLNTSDIVYNTTDYQKQVNDRVNAYNSAVNQWIGQASASIQPSSIASNLVSSLLAQGFTDIGTVGGTVFLSNVSSVSCDDGGDGTLFRAVFNTVDDASKLSSIHLDGKVVQVKANNQVDPYYMVFKADVAGQWSTGKWVEGPAQIVQPGQVFAVAGISTDGNTLTLGSTAAVLNTKGFSCPGFAGSVCGDKDQTGAIPYFFGKKISLLTTFQDRLVVVSDGTIFMSRVGDYFNFFRKTMLSVQDDDPMEMYALGAADDVISKCVTYNKNLFLFGLRNQYVISGTQMATPQTVVISTVASEKEAMYAQPVTQGNLIFYGTHAAASLQDSPSSPYCGIMNQFQLGLFMDTPETYQISKQLSKYMKGRPIEMACINTPPTLFVRTDGYDSGCYVYSYLDSPGSQERQWDSWGRWEFSSALGVLIGVSPYQQRIIQFHIMPNRATGANAMVMVACELTMDTKDRTAPFFDCQQTADALGSPINGQLGAWNTTSMWGDAYAAIGSSQPEFLLASKLSQWGAFQAQYPSIALSKFVTGFDFDSHVTLTSPYVRDNNDKAVVNGRLTVSKYTVSLTDTSGATVTVDDVTGDGKQIGAYNARLVGLSNNLIGRVPITTSTFSVPVGRANTEHKVTFHAVPGLPMTLSAIEWVGQFFTSGRRV